MDSTSDNAGALIGHWMFALGRLHYCFLTDTFIIAFGLGT